MGEQLNADLRESINQAYAGQQPEPMPTDPIRAVDWLVHLQENAPRIKGLSFGPVHGANGGEAVAIWPMGKPPKVNPDGSIVESENVRILDQKLFVNAYPTLPTVSEWALGSANVPAHGTVLRGSAADPGNPATFFGWPMAINSNDGLSSCMGPHPNSYSTFEVTPSGDSRSTSTSERRLAAVAGGAPVNLLFTDASGKRFGFDAKGNRVAELEGTIVNDGRVQTYMLPKGAYKVSIAGTAKGVRSRSAATERRASRRCASPSRRARRRRSR